jgi:hypothetical protein
MRTGFRSFENKELYTNILFQNCILYQQLFIFSQSFDLFVNYLKYLFIITPTNAMIYDMNIC